MVVQAKHTLHLKQDSLSSLSLCPPTQPHLSMEIIDNHFEYQNYWETNRFWNEDLDYRYPFSHALILAFDVQTLYLFCSFCEVYQFFTTEFSA